MANFLTSLFSRKPATSRDPAFAGHLYPSDPKQLAEKLAPMVNVASSIPDKPLPERLEALVLPFGELDFIAPTITPALSLLAQPECKQQVERIVLIAAAQRIPFRGLALSSVDAWQTPLGYCWCDTEMNTALAERFPDAVRYLDAAHGPEPAIEVILPMLQAIFGAGKKEMPLITPILVGDGATDDLVTVLDAIYGGEGVLVVLATELAVGVSADDAERLGAELEEAVEALTPDAITRYHASGRVPLKAILARAARQPGALAATLARSHSMAEEVAHLRVVSEREEDLVVGYGAFAIGE